MKELEKIALGGPVVGAAILKLLRKGDCQVFDSETKAYKKGLSSSKQVTLKVNQDIQNASFIPGKNYFAYVTHYRKDGASMPYLYWISSEKEARNLFNNFGATINHVTWLSSSQNWSQVQDLVGEVDAELKQSFQRKEEQALLLKKFGFLGERLEGNPETRRILCTTPTSYGACS